MLVLKVMSFLAKKLKNKLKTLKYWQLFYFGNNRCIGIADMYSKIPIA